MVFINLFDLVELMCVVLLEFVVGIDDIFVVICDVKGVNVESGEKLLVKGLFFIFFVVECGFVGWLIVEFRVWLFKLELWVKGVCLFMVWFDEMFF